jgi:hypothetical protein
VLGSGAYLMNWKGETSAAGKKMQNLRAQGMAQEVWKHTTELLSRTVEQVRFTGKVAYSEKLC